MDEEDQQGMKGKDIVEVQYVREIVRNDSSSMDEEIDTSVIEEQ